MEVRKGTEYLIKLFVEGFLWHLSHKSLAVWK